MKLLNSIKCLWLMFFSTKIFRPEDVFKGKRVAVIGAADSAFEKENGEFIDKFDYVIRINKAPSSWIDKNEKYTGKKTDIWFHSFFENEESGGGPLSPEIFKQRGIEIIVNPRTTIEAYRRTFNFYRKYGHSLTVFHISSEIYKSLKRKFPNNLRPTVGLIALFSALNSPCKELFITGFTFFKTPYAKGYRDHLIDLNENKKHFKKQGIHNADLEYNLFKKALKVSPCKKILLDNKLNKILIND